MECYYVLFQKKGIETILFLSTISIVNVLKDSVEPIINLGFLAL